MKHNGHVLKFMRWRYFIAGMMRRPFAQLVWATEYQRELESDG